MTNSLKYSLIGAIIVAAVILVIAASTGPKGSPVTDGEASLTLLQPSGGEIEVGQVQDVRWISTNYAAPTVKLNVIRKVSDNPARYELVREVASATRDDGKAVWVPAVSDAGSGILVEVGCAPSSQACRASQSSAALAVSNTGRYQNTASVYDAIERENNE